VIDSLDMWGAAAGLPEQISSALGAADGVALPQASAIDGVVVLGMGGSGIAGDVLAAAGASSSPVPIVVVKSYDLPAWVGSRTLVLAVSFSGRTEETLSAVADAWAVGASVVAVTSGGELAAKAAAAGAPVIDVPRTIPQPRAAIAALAVPLLVAGERIGLLPDAREHLVGALDLLRQRRDELLGPSSVAADLARRIGRTMPLFHGASGFAAVAAQRWKTQVNENAKSPAFYAVQPELSHNELAGWGQHGDMTRQVMTAVLLRTGDESPQIVRRFGFVAEMLQEVTAEVIEFVGRGDSPLGRFFDLVLVGDFVSLHLAERDGVDPGPVPILAEMKNYLASTDDRVS
jgi:glucose/mannose-6-phosphate isomerase